LSQVTGYWKFFTDEHLCCEILINGQERIEITQKGSEIEISIPVTAMRDDDNHVRSNDNINLYGTIINDSISTRGKYQFVTKLTLGGITDYTQTILNLCFKGQVLMSQYRIEGALEIEAIQKGSDGTIITNIDSSGSHESYQMYRPIVIYLSNW
jgi:hypothetical protein